jgi:hypothetical protein
VAAQTLIYLQIIRVSSRSYYSIIASYTPNTYSLCGLVVRVHDYRFRGPGFDSRRYQNFWEVVGLERGPLSLVSTIEQLLERKNSGSVLENCEYDVGILHADHVAPSIRKSWH